MYSEDTMLNMEGLSAEAKIGKILVLVGVIIGILAIVLLGAIAVLTWTAGGVSGLGIALTMPRWIIVAVLGLKTAGLIFGLLALVSAGRNDFSKAGIFAVISSILPPLDLVMLIGGIFCLISREANEVQIRPPP